MTAIDILTKRLVELGATTEIIVLVVEAVTVARDGHAGHKLSRVTPRYVTPDDLRKANRLRQRKHREKVKLQQLAAKEAEANDAAAKSVTVTRDKRDKAAVAPTSLLPFFSESLNKEGSSEKGSKQKKKEGPEIARARGQHMAADAILTDEYHEAARVLGAAPQDIQEIWTEFVDYWVAIPGQRGCKTDWPATWRNRVRTVLKRGNGNGHAKQQSLSERASILAEQARSAERAAGIDRSDDPFRSH